MALQLSVVVISYNMRRELPRTLKSLSPTMQQGIGAGDYEIIVIDNGSAEPFHEDALKAIAPNLRLYNLTQAAHSPVPAINLGLELAHGELVGVCIDGARMASPGLLSKALAASRLHTRAVVGTFAFHLGSEVQMQSVKKGYNQQVEDQLLTASGWEQDGYRLFDISVFAGSSQEGWFELPAESNAFFLRANHWRTLGGWDERFVTPGGGFVNHDTWARACAVPDSEVILLLGEATFHQVHGGVATNNPNPPMALFHEEYIRIRGGPYVRPTRKPTYFGSVPVQILPSLRMSVAKAEAQAQLQQAT